MQRILLLALFLAASFWAGACETQPYTGGQPKLLSDALESAQVDGKPILIDVFATW